VVAAFSAGAGLGAISFAIAGDGVRRIGFALAAFVGTLFVLHEGLLGTG
jgi:hypothetical protein